MDQRDLTKDIVRNFVTEFVLEVACAYGLDEDETFDLLWDYEAVINRLKQFHTRGLTRETVDIDSAFGMAAMLGRSLADANIGQTGAVTPVVWATLFCRRCAELIDINDRELLYLLIQVVDIFERHLVDKNVGIIPTGIAEQLRAVV